MDHHTRNACASAHVPPCCRDAAQVAATAAPRCSTDQCLHLLLLAMTQRENAERQISHEEADLQVGG